MVFLENSGLLAIFLSIFWLSACHNKQATDSRSTFSTNIVRINDAQVAQVDGTPIFYSDVKAQAIANGEIADGAKLSTDDPIFRSTLDELIDQRVLALEALRQSLDQQEDTRQKILAMREKILANAIIENRLSTVVNDEAVRRLYDEQAALKTNAKEVRARIIVVGSQEDADAIVQRLADGEEFATLAKTYSIDNSSGDIGGDLGYFSKNAYKPALAKLAFSLKNNEISDPTEIDGEWVIVKTLDRRMPPQPEFEDIRDNIEEFMTYDEIAKLVKSLRSSSDVKLMLNATKTTDVEINPVTPDAGTAEEGVEGSVEEPVDVGIEKDTENENQ